MLWTDSIHVELIIQKQQQFIIYQVVMNSRSLQRRKGGLISCTCTLIVTGTILLVVDFIQIASYNSLQSQISQSNCGQACGSSYSYQRYGQCCQYSDYSSCRSRYECLSSLRYKKDSIAQTIPALSIISGFLLLIGLLLFCLCKLWKKAGQPNQAALLAQPNYHINQSEQSSVRKIDLIYDSFAYVDEQNACSICLESFKNQKAILLKCGHIFHSTCIRDWATKQENCPVCRSSQ